MECRCPICGQYFNDFEDLADHVESEHDMTLVEALNHTLVDTED